jgi:hypothetical protein
LAKGKKKKKKRKPYPLQGKHKRRERELDKWVQWKKASDAALWNSTSMLLVLLDMPFLEEKNSKLRLRRERERERERERAGSKVATAKMIFWLCVET